MTDAKQYLTPEQLVKRWEDRITKGTLSNWRARKPHRGPVFTKVGGRVLYSLASVQAYEAANTNEAAKAA
jgi:hypothetical protein